MPLAARSDPLQLLPSQVELDAMLDALPSDAAHPSLAKKVNPIFELTNLLFTGKTSAAMREFLGGSGKLSERVSSF